MLTPGDTIGLYRIEREIGRGGMAVVYLAYHLRLERPVALKVLHEHLQHDAELVERFLFEARAAARLDHNHIVAIYDAGSAAGVDYIAMEYVEGESLADILHRVSGPLPLDFTVSVVNQVAEALDYAHHRGIVHRDIKPSNILVRANGHTLLTDFGIARAASLQATTARGTILGTPEYMSPEQAEGRLVDGRSDVYSLGIVGFYALTGQPPFRGDTPQAILYAHVHQPLPDPCQINPQLSPVIADVLRTATAKDPVHRYPTAGAFAKALQAAVHPTQPLLAIPNQPPPAAKKRSSPLWIYALIGFLLGVGALAIAAWAMLSNQPPPPTPLPAPIVGEVATPSLPAAAPPASATPSPTATSSPSPSPSPSPTLSPTPTQTFTPTPTPNPYSRLVYVSDRSGSPQLYSIRSDGSEDRQLTSEGRNDRPFWAADGSVIFFLRDTGKGPALWSMRADGSEQNELLFVPGADHYSLSPDGLHTAYTLRQGDDLELILDGAHWATITGALNTYVWAPDGENIVLELANGPRVLYVLGVGSNTLQPLTEPSYSSWNPTWSPGSLQLAFASTRDGNAGIYRMVRDGSGVLRLTPLEVWSQAPSWSPDAGAIAHVSGEADNAWALYLMRADGGERSLLYRPVAPEAMPVWSPDGEKIAFILNDGDPELAVIRRDGSGFVQLTANEANDWAPAWEPRR